MVVADKVDLTKYSDLAFWVYVLSVVALPIGLGGNRPFPLGLMQAGLAISCFLLFVSAGSFTPPRFFPRLKVALILLLIVVVWSIIQALPLVPSHFAHPLWGEAQDILGVSIKGTIAIAPEDSFVGIGRLLTYIATGIISYMFAQNVKRARQMITTFFVAGTLISAYGLIEFISGSKKILWFDKWAYETDLTATFVNRNHFAIYAGLVVVCGAALLLQSFRDGVLAQTKQVRSQVAREWLMWQGTWRFFSLVMVLLCIVLSHSRSGLILALGGTGSYFFLYQLYRKEFGRALITALAAFIVMVLVVMTALEYSDRFPSLFTDYSSRDRMHVYELTMNAIRDNPLLGYGLDGFQPVFRIYQRGMIMEFVHAHSDILESLLDLGLIGGFLLWLAIIILVSGLARGIARRRRNGIYPCLALSCCIIVLGHSMVDFSMQIPGVVCSWAMILGAGLAQSWRQSEKQNPSDLRD